MDHGQSMFPQAKLRPTHFHPQNLNYNYKKSSSIGFFKGMNLVIFWRGEK